MKKPLLILLALSLAACSDQRQASYGGHLTVDQLPADVCYIGGIPQVNAVSLEDDGDIDFVYVSTEGHVISQKYGTRGLSFTTHAQGTLSWERREGRPKPKCDP